MTSTNVNIGFTDTKNSSRVLRPPGGGHSDIFGVRGDNDLHTPNKRKNHPQSTISSCFMQESEVTKPANTKNGNEDLKNGNQNDTKTDVVDENTEPKEANGNKDEKEENEQVQTAAPSRKARVPPGGYSTGFW